MDMYPPTTTVLRLLEKIEELIGPLPDGPRKKIRGDIEKFIPDFPDSAIVPPPYEIYDTIDKLKTLKPGDCIKVGFEYIGKKDVDCFGIVKEKYDPEGGNSRIKCSHVLDADGSIDTYNPGTGFLFLSTGARDDGVPNNIIKIATKSEKEAFLEKIIKTYFWKQ